MHKLFLLYNELISNYYYEPTEILLDQEIQFQQFSIIELIIAILLQVQKQYLTPYSPQKPMRFRTESEK